MRTSTLISLALLIPVAQGFSPIPSSSKISSSSALSAINEQQSRSSFLQTLSGSAAAVIFSPLVANAEDETVATTAPPAAAPANIVKLPSGTMYEVIKSGDGPKPIVGELGAIRFRAEVKQTGNKIDDVFDTPEPYYTRVGSGGLLKVRIFD